MFDFMSYFDGLMLGDGCLDKNNNSINYRYSQGCMASCKEWLEYIRKRFELEGIYCNMYLQSKAGIYYDKSFGRFINRSGNYLLASHSYDFFTEQEKRWYRKDYNVDEYNTHYWHKDINGDWYIRKKIVPKDIRFTPECIANWYMGDGTIGRTANNYGTIKLFTNSFTKEEVDFLSFILEDQIVETTYVGLQSSKMYIIQINKRLSSRVFLDYVRPCVEKVKCFNYKLIEVI